MPWGFTRREFMDLQPATGWGQGSLLLAQKDGQGLHKMTPRALPSLPWCPRSHGNQPKVDSARGSSPLSIALPPHQQTTSSSFMSKKRLTTIVWPAAPGGRHNPLPVPRPSVVSPVEGSSLPPPSPSPQGVLGPFVLEEAER